MLTVQIAVTATIPWDSYLIRTKIWTYPAHVVIGPKLFDIPLEEVFFFVIQTYNTSLLYLILSKPTFRPAYIRHEAITDRWRYYKSAGTLVLVLILRRAFSMFRSGGEGTYLSLILLWALPFVTLLWNLAYQFIIGLPFSETLLPIMLPTVYLWIVDTLALKRGTWVIESGTKLGIHLWPGLEIEEAVFFLLTNTMIVFGLLAFDNAVALIDTFPSRPATTAPSALPSPAALVKALLAPSSRYDKTRLASLRQAISVLRGKSRSFYLASSVFERGLRTDLILLYSFCRVADDLIDTAQSRQDAQLQIDNLRSFLDTAYNPHNDEPEGYVHSEAIKSLVETTFPIETHFALLQLPISRLPSEPFHDLLKGFETDLKFSTPTPTFPIHTEHDLDTYGARVAGTVAVLCLSQVWTHFPASHSTGATAAIEAAAANMGIALQYVNIARDLARDAQAKRLYIPLSWLKDMGSSPESVLASLAATGGTVNDTELLNLRSRLLDRAFALYEDARPAIERLPSEVRPGMRVAVESYMEIGRTLRAGTRNALELGSLRTADPFERGVKGSLGSGAGRATVPLGRRLLVAYSALVK